MSEKSHFALIMMVCYSTIETSDSIGLNSPPEVFQQTSHHMIIFGIYKFMSETNSSQCPKDTTLFSTKSTCTDFKLW